MTNSDQYTDEMLNSMQTTYGAGFLSPGGAQETRQMVEGLSVSGCDVLDLGCGMGGAAQVLVNELAANHVTGVDVEEKQITTAKKLVENARLSSKITIKQVASSPLPFADETFHIILTKDVVSHIPDRLACFADMYRLLKPGGVLVVADWLRGKSNVDGLFDTWAGQLAAGGLVFYFEPVEVYVDLMKQVGFSKVITTDHTEWSHQCAAEQLSNSTQPAHEAAMAKLGHGASERRNRMTMTRLEGLTKREIEHWHIRGIKD